MLKTNKNDIARFSIYQDPSVKFDNIHWNYIPIAYDNFITICVDNIYQYWDEAIEMVLAPLYVEGVRVIAFSLQGNAKIQGALNINNIDIRQAAFLLKKTRYHFCGQDWSLTLAQNNDICNNVFLKTGDLSEVFIEEKLEYIEDLFKPELVAENIFSKLNIKQEVYINTKLIGPAYGVEILEIIPNFELTQAPDIPSGSMVGIRCDLYENWDFVLKAVSMGLNPVVISKSLPSLPIGGFLNGVKSINLYVNENTKPEEIKQIQSAGVPIRLLSQAENSSVTKRNLFDCENIIPFESWSKDNLDKLKDLPYDTKLRTKKMLVSKEGTFLSVYHWKNNLPISEKKGLMLLDAIEDEDFLVEADTFYYYN